MDNKELYLRIGELYAQLHRITDMYQELTRKNQDLQEQISVLKHGQPNEGNPST